MTVSWQVRYFLYLNELKTNRDSKKYLRLSTNNVFLMITGTVSQLDFNTLKIFRKSLTTDHCDTGGEVKGKTHPLGVLKEKISQVFSKIMQ
jgi:hypothetical protein